eukprot:2071712-Rhodomonas_salina.3
MAPGKWENWCEKQDEARRGQGSERGPRARGVGQCRVSRQVFAAEKQGRRRGGGGSMGWRG